MQLSNDVLVFDLDDTIIISQHLHLKAYQEAYKEITGNELSQSNLELFDSELNNGASLAMQAIGVDTITQEKIKAMKIILFNLHYKDLVTLNPRAIDMINNSSCDLNIITNSSNSNTFYYLTRFNLADKFRFVITRDTYHTLKPSAKLGAYMESYYKDKVNFTYIGDSKTDELFASNCNWNFINIKN